MLPAFTLPGFSQRSTIPLWIAQERSSSFHTSGILYKKGLTPPPWYDPETHNNLEGVELKLFKLKNFLSVKKEKVLLEHTHLPS